MTIRLADWVFQVDPEATRIHTQKCSADHCTCPYCQNFYENVATSHPSLGPVLSRFGIVLNGPSEVMPFEPTLVMVCYRVTGQILQPGQSRLHVNQVPLRMEPADESSFFLWAGEMELPWTQEEDPDEVLSPANQPEFLDRMMKRWLETRDELELT
jgi:hypothetical protein